MNKLEIINYALVGKLAVNKIDTYDSETAQGRVVRSIYPTVYEAALESFNWPFARTTTGALALVGESAEGNEQYQLPGRWEQITRIFTDGGYELTFRTVGNLIELIDEDLGDNNTLHVEYIKLVDEGVVPAYFGKWVAVEYAAQSCMAHTENSALADRLVTEADKLGKKARKLARLAGGSEFIGNANDYSMLRERRG